MQNQKNFEIWKILPGQLTRNMKYFLFSELLNCTVAAYGISPDLVACEIIMMNFVKNKYCTILTDETLNVLMALALESTDFLYTSCFSLIW